ncbi:MAG: hypothetical protein NVS9B11_12900 [Candidatus Dormibacteraceae bacterium]
MSVGSSPPQTPPRMSPDGKWVWDGRQWQPVPVVLGDLAGVAPVAAAVAAPAPAPVGVAYAPAQVQGSAIPYAVPTAEEADVPLWVEKPRPGISMYLFAAAALVVLIMAMMALNSLNIVRMPWESDAQIQARATPTPTTTLTTRSDYARADRFLNVTLSPEVTALNQTLPALTQACSGTLSVSCQQSITASDLQLKKVIAVIDRGDFPPCIAAEVGKVRADFAGMDDGLQLALKGFADNKLAELNQGLARFGAAGPALSADTKALDLAFHSQCSTLRTGP